MSAIKKTISIYFSENLNAPFTNVVWSWGSENDIGIYLRIWSDKFDGVNYCLYTPSSENERNGQKERLNHVKSIYQGKPGYAVVITKHHELANGQRVIDDYDECIYKISNIVITENGSYMATVDLENPIHPEYIENNVNKDDAIVLCSKNPDALAKLDKAINKLNWKIIGIDKLKQEICLLSKDGKATAKICIPSAEWVRI